MNSGNSEAVSAQRLQACVHTSSGTNTGASTGAKSTENMNFM